METGRFPPIGAADARAVAAFEVIGGWPTAWPHQSNGRIIWCEDRSVSALSEASTNQISGRDSSDWDQSSQARRKRLRLEDTRAEPRQESTQQRIRQNRSTQNKAENAKPTRERTKQEKATSENIQTNERMETLLCHKICEDTRPCPSNPSEDTKTRAAETCDERGLGCQHAVQTREGYVCSLTGRCIGQIYGVSAGAEHKGGTYAGKGFRANISLSHGDAMYMKSKEPLVANKTEDDTAFTECYRVVQKLLGDTSKADMESRVRLEAIEAGLKTAGRKVRSSAHHRPNLMEAAFSGVDALQEHIVDMLGPPELQGDGNGLEEARADHLARQCMSCFSLCKRFQDNTCKRGVPCIQYVAIATLYLMKDGISYHEKWILPKDDWVHDNLEPPNMLKTKGYEISKYTLAGRYIRNCLMMAFDTAPLRDIRM